MSHLKEKRSGNHIDKQTLKKLYAQRSFPWLFDTIMDWAILLSAITIATLYPHPFIILLSIIVVGNRQHALVILGHDGSHHTLLGKNKKLNDFFSNFFLMWPAGLTVQGYRSLHKKHHNELGTDNDPEMLHKKTRSPQWDLPNTPKEILRYCFLDLIGYSLPDYKIIVTFSKPEKRHTIALCLFHVITISVLIALGLYLPLFIWYVSLPTAFMMFFRLRLWIEHQGTDDTIRLHLNRWQGALLSPHLGWYHWEHHQWPGVPYYNLPQLRQAVESDDEVWTLRDHIDHIKTARETLSGQIYGT